MSAPVEASSLSSLAGLLANPPQYPRNPTHPKHEPLVLYIVRVPGKNDVFLTPLKPPTKASIGLEAIQSSLYYLHVETDEDEQVRQSFEIERQLEQQRSRAPSILRKPLPPTPFANYPRSRRPTTPPKSYPHHQPSGDGGDTQAARYKSRGSYLRLDLGRTDSLPRRPLGARALPSESHGNDFEALDGVADNEHRWSVPDRRPAPYVPCLNTSSDLNSNTSPGIENASPASPTKSPARAEAGGPVTTITLIRRDPSSGVQWNVGSIEVTPRRSSMALLSAVEIALTTPGYGRFSSTPDSPRKLERLDEGLTASAMQGSAVPSLHADHVFRRRVCFRPLPNDQKPSLQHIRTNSSDVLSNLPNGISKKVQQVFAFTSPWQGVCAFGNGVDGRTLKCRHTLPSSGSHSNDFAAAIAEIRFNLPWTVLNTKDPNKQRPSEAEKLPISQLVGRSTREQWRRSVQTFKHHDWPGKKEENHESTSQSQTITQEGIDEHSRISLKLGREKAGGGFKGNSAKLGKLIIEDEGLKMGDLVVAASMGVWWQHYLEGS